jgi:hypothetical protein
MQVFQQNRLEKGYHQIPMNPADICKTAIATPFWLLKYTQMSFGFKNASNTFQRKIDWVTSDLDFCLRFKMTSR